MTTRPVILVDLDNVVYDWVGAMAHWLEDNGALHYEGHWDEDRQDFILPAEQAIASYSQWAVWDDWGIPKGEFIRWWRLGIEAGRIYKQGPLIPGAREALWRLSDAEWDIHIATSRLTKFGLHDQIIMNTASWLRDNNIPYRNCHFTDDKKAIVAEAIVDDRADNMSVARHGKRFEFGAPHNKSGTTWADIMVALGV